MGGLIGRVKTYVQHHGITYTIYRGGQKAAEKVFRLYDRAWQRMKATEEELDRQRKEGLDAGLISVVVPVYNTDPGMLREMVDSLLAQTYQHWEAILFDDCSPSEATREALRSVAALDERIRVFRGEKNQGISGGSNSAVSLSRGEWIALLDHDDLLTPDALYWVARAAADQQPDMIYSDEDKVTQNGRRHTDPHFKPDFSPDNLRSGNYICHLMVMRRSLLEKAGGFRSAFNGSQDHDLALRCTEHTDRIVHIPRVLYHWRTVGTSVSHQNLMKCVNAACAAVQEHTRRIGWPAETESHLGNIRIRYEIKGEPVVGVYIFGEDDQALAAGRRQAEGFSWPHKRVHTIRCGMDERYAAMNRAAESSQEDVLLMMDASVQAEAGDVITELLMYAQRDDVGAVTPELVSRKGKITHGGFAVDMEHLVQCRQEGLPHHSGGWHLLMQTSHNVAAVSAACLMIRRDHYTPFDEEYSSGLGAADWSLKLGRKGYLHVFTPHARCICENKDLLLAGKKRSSRDAARFAAAWQGVKDPYYSGLFSRKKANYSLKRMKKKV